MLLAIQFDSRVISVIVVVMIISHIISLIFGISSITFYCLVVFGLLRIYKTSGKANIFYLMLIIHGVADIGSLFNNYLFLSIPRWGWFYDFFMYFEFIIPKLTYIISSLCSGIQIQTTFLLGLNRLVSIIQARKIDLVCQTKLFIYVFTLGPGIIISSIVPFSELYYKTTDEGGVMPAYRK